MDSRNTQKLTFNLRKVRLTDGTVTLDNAPQYSKDGILMVFILLGRRTIKLMTKFIASEQCDSECTKIELHESVFSSRGFHESHPLF